MKFHLQKDIDWGKVLKIVSMQLLMGVIVVEGAYAGNNTPAASFRSEASVLSKINVTGKVTDSKGEPLVGVSVKIKGTSTATSTDADGVFRLNLPTGNETLVFSYIGFETREVAVNGQLSINVQLTETTSKLNEVVVVGYGEQKRAHLTGSVVSIDASEIEDIPVSNLGAAIAGRMLGVSSSGGISRPGSTATLSVRRPVEFFGKDGGNTGPLYVIDGVIQVGGNGQPDNTLFNNLDPSEVESITVLKDGAAAVYGTRAANGVVLVTTKRGKAGPPRISYNGSYAINDKAYTTKMMNAYQFAQYFNIMNGPNGENKSAGVDNFFSQDELDHFKNYNYSWLDDAWSSSYNTRHTLSVSGGADRATYFADVSYYNQNGNLSSLDYDRWNFRAGADAYVANHLKAGLQVSGNYSDLKKTFNKVNSENEDDDYRNLILAPPYIPPYIDGYPVKLPGTDKLAGYNYYEIERLNNIATDNDKLLTVNLYAEYELPFVKGLKARASYARNMGNSAASQLGTTYPLYEFNRAGDNQHIYDEGATPILTNVKKYKNGDRLYYSNINQKSVQSNFLLSYNRQFGKHSISGLVSVERSESSSNQEDVWKESPSLSTNGQFSTAFGAIDGKTAAAEAGSLSYIGRVNYSYADKYLAEFLFRSDASTKFAPDHYWGKFYSGSVGWVISKEDFFHVPAIDFLKLRYSTGLLGNDQMRPWLWRQRYTFQDGKGAVFGGNSNTSIGMKMEASPNPDATWSNEYKNNLGIDAEFLHSRLSATIEGYYNHATDILIERTGNVPVTVGGSVASQNYGIENIFGYEISLGWNDRIGKDFRYGIDTRFTWGDNKVVRMNFNDNDIMYPWNAQPGKSSDNGMWGYDYLGMFHTQQDIDNYVQKYNIKDVFGTQAADLKPGMLYYRDVRGPLQADGTFAAPDGIIDDNDQIQLTKKKSNHYGFGTTLKAGYKGFSFDCVIVGSFGGWSEIDARDKMNNNISRVYQNLPVIWGNIYDPDINPTGTMPNPNWSDISLDPESKFWQVSAFRMRMNNFSISYTLPKKVVDQLKIHNARVYFVSENPMTFYNPYSYRDPDFAYDVFPNLRTYSFGVNLTL